MTVAEGAMEQQQQAIVIGSGFGGLAAAIRLGAKGYQVTVLEALDAPGGRAYVFKQDGFIFDAGPTIITAPFLFEELWALCGRRLADDVELVELDPAYQIRFADGTVFNYSADPAKMRAEVERLCPADLDAYDRFMVKSREIYGLFERLGDRPFSRFSDMLSVAPDLVRNSGYQTVYGLVRRYFSDERLRVVFSFHPLLVGGNPFDTTAIYTLIAHLERSFGVHFAMGGTGALVDGMVRLIEGQGGVVRCDAPVATIRTEEGKVAGVTLRSGERLDAPLVVSNADAINTYEKLLDRPRQRWTTKKAARSRSSMGLFVWYFGTEGVYPEVPHHLILMGPRYQGLLDDIFKKKILADDFSLYLHRPTATDSSLAPPGCETFYVLSPVPNLDAGVDWITMAETYRARIAAALEATVLPGLSERLRTSRMITPLDFRDRLDSYRGAGFSLEPILFQSAWFRPNNRSEEVEGLYLVGAGTHPGAGLPGVLSTAKVLEHLIPHAPRAA